MSEQQSSAVSAQPVAWRVDGIRQGKEQVWFYWKPEWPVMHEEQGDKVTPLYDRPARTEPQSLRELAEACRARAQERDDAQGNLLLNQCLDAEHRDQIAGLLGVSGPDRGWTLLLARLNECLTTMRGRSQAASVEATISIDLMQRIWANLYFDEAEAGGTFQHTLNEVVEWLAARNALPSALSRPVRAEHDARTPQASDVESK
jgi:hypothetical protein